MADNVAAQTPIRLELGATADPNTCGSCAKFERTESWNGMAGGYCTMTLPPQYARVPYDPEGKPPNQVNDTHNCDLYRHSGKAYIVSKLLRP